MGGFMKSLTLQEEYILLAVLQLDDNAYLITLREHLKAKTGKEYSIGSIYVPLDRMWKLGYLDTRIGKPSPKVGGRSIKYYQINEMGKSILADNKKIHDRMWLGFAEDIISQEK